MFDGLGEVIGGFEVAILLSDFSIRVRVKSNKLSSPVFDIIFCLIKNIIKMQ